jgi:diadenosine tetraphosphate (Ap4A) HIT family hydrolase
MISSVPRTDCPLCAPTPADQWQIQLGTHRLIRANDPDLPVFYRVIWNAHIPEFTDLSDADALLLMQTVRSVERTVRHELIRAGLPADKFNVASLGNMVAHQHWHVVARFKTDAFWPGSPWSARQREADAAQIAALQGLVPRINQALAQALAGFTRPAS